MSRPIPLHDALPQAQDVLPFDEAAAEDYGTLHARLAAGEQPPG